MSRTRTRQWSGRQQAAVAAAAAVAAFGVLVGAALLWDTTHPPSVVRHGPATATSPPPTTIPAASAAELLRSSAAALRATTTAHVAGAIGGGASPVRVDLSVTANGDAQGTLVIAGVPVDVVRTGGRTYVRSRQLIESIAGATVASYVGDRWVALDPGRLGSGTERALDQATSLDGIASLIETSAGMAQAGVPTTLAGRRVTEVVSGITVIDVAADGPPYPLRVAAGEGTTLDLGRFGQSVVVVAPSRGVVDLDRLPGIG
ncbi:MAG: hypothetical protein ACJ74O_01445 [Frankiaceae bacterium]